MALAAVAAALGNTLNGYFNTKPKIEALQKRETELSAELAEVKDKHKDCERHREEMQKLLLDIMGEKLKGDRARNDRDALADVDTPQEHFRA
jgi:F0F1-type ATP synthase membrane subunit b/b'